MRTGLAVGMTIGMALLVAVPANAGLLGLPGVLNLPAVLLLDYDEVRWYTEPAFCFSALGDAFDFDESTDPTALALVEPDFAAGTVDITVDSSYGIPGVLPIRDHCGVKSDAFVGCTVTAGAAPGGAGQTIECGNPLVREDPYVFDSFLAIHDRADGTGWLYYQANELHPDSVGNAYLVHRISGNIAL